MLNQLSITLARLYTFLKSSAPIAVIALIAVNLLPLFGVLYWDWNLYSVMFLFWLESGVIGLYTVLKMLTAQGESGQAMRFAGLELSSHSWAHMPLRLLGRMALAAFFCFHYGLFWVIHGSFVQLFFGGMSTRIIADALIASPASLGMIADSALLNVAGIMLVSHGISFVSNYLGHNEYQIATPRRIMIRAYGRVMVLHIVVLAGGGFVLNQGEPTVAIVLLVGLKTVFDLTAHLREHARYQKQGG